MTNRELIIYLIEQPMDADIKLEVGGDGAIHSGYAEKVSTEREALPCGDIILSSEGW